MRAALTSLTLAMGLTTGGAAVAQSNFDVASADEQRAILIQCQQDLGYGAAGLTIRTSYASNTIKGGTYALQVTPNAQISPAAATEINTCARTSAAAVVYGQTAPAPRQVRAAPVVQRAANCPPGAPVLYRGTLYCRN